MNMINQIAPKTVETLASASKTTQAKNLGTVAKTAADKFQSSASKLISSRGGKIAAFGAAAALIALAGKYVLSLVGKNNAPVIPNLNDIANGLDCERVSREEFMKGAKAGTAGNLENTVRAKIADGHNAGTVDDLEEQCRQISLSRKSSAPVIPNMKRVMAAVSKENVCSGEDFLEAVKNGHAVKTYNIED